MNWNQVATWLTDQDAWTLCKLPRKQFEKQGGCGRDGFSISADLVDVQ